jgi:hypothetical protein
VTRGAAMADDQKVRGSTAGHDRVQGVAGAGSAMVSTP